MQIWEAVHIYLNRDRSHLENSVEQLATLATAPFKSSPWCLGQGNLLTILFSADNTF